MSTYMDSGYCRSPYGLGLLSQSVVPDVPRHDFLGTWPGPVTSQHPLLQSAIRLEKPHTQLGFGSGQPAWTKTAVATTEPIMPSVLLSLDICNAPFS